MPSPAHPGQRVLVVDDDLEFGTAASLLLVASGYDVVGQPGTAADGLSAALALRPDVVLLDISLPDGNGFDVAKQLTELESPAALIMISSRESSGFTAAACESGALGFVPKSKFSVSSIRALLDSGAGGRYG
jgi:DNA-binding NarL/FixJ family response regulator